MASASPGLLLTQGGRVVLTPLLGTSPTAAPLPGTPLTSVPLLGNNASEGYQCKLWSHIGNLSDTCMYLLRPMTPPVLNLLYFVSPLFQRQSVYTFYMRCI